MIVIFKKIDCSIFFSLSCLSVLMDYTFVSSQPFLYSCFNLKKNKKKSPVIWALITKQHTERLCSAFSVLSPERFTCNTACVAPSASGLAGCLQRYDPFAVFTWHRHLRALLLRRVQTSFLRTSSRKCSLLTIINFYPYVNNILNIFN